MLSRRQVLSLLKALTLLGIGWVTARVLAHLFIFGPRDATSRRHYLGRASDVLGRIDSADGHYLLDEEHKVVLLRGERGGNLPEGGELTALSLFCTHLGCTLRASSDGETLECPCHGSRFSLTPDEEGRVGTVLNGPATRELPPCRVIRQGDRLFLET